MYTCVCIHLCMTSGTTPGSGAGHDISLVVKCSSISKSLMIV